MGYVGAVHAPRPTGLQRQDVRLAQPDELLDELEALEEVGPVGHIGPVGHTGEAERQGVQPNRAIYQAGRPILRRLQHPHPQIRQHQRDGHPQQHLQPRRHVTEGFLLICDCVLIGTDLGGKLTLVLA